MCGKGDERTVPKGRNRDVREEEVGSQGPRSSGDGGRGPGGRELFRRGPRTLVYPIVVTGGPQRGGPDS